MARSADGSFREFGDQQLRTPESVVCYANTAAKVTHWLEHGEAPWCRPGQNMGPDLLTWVRFGDGSVRLLVIQAKSHRAGNNTTVAATATALAIRQVTPRLFYHSSVRT
jgi:hypothetical protein